MSRVARRGNVCAIRPGIAIPDQRDEDDTARINAKITSSFLDKAYALAQIEPNSDAHRFALHMAAIDHKLPRNNLRLIVTPTAPREEWFQEAWRKVRIARAAVDLIESQHGLAAHLDRFDRGERATELRPEMEAKRAAYNLAVLDCLRTPVTKKGEVARKQDIVGKREWAEKYRPEWQAIIDEELARFPAKARKSRTAGGEA
jgi:hypothetical protein